MNIKRIIILIIIILVIVVGIFAYISINSHNTKIEVLSNSTLKNGDFFTVVLKDDYRNVYPGEIIEIKILDDSGWANKYSVTTDDSGEASVELLGFNNGNYTVHSTHNKTLFISESKDISSLVIDDGY